MSHQNGTNGILAPLDRKIGEYNTNRGTSRMAQYGSVPPGCVTSHLSLPLEWENQKIYLVLEPRTLTIFPVLELSIFPGTHLVSFAKRRAYFFERKLKLDLSFFKTATGFRDQIVKKDLVLE